MKFDMYFNPVSKIYSFSGSYTETELELLDLSPLDIAVMHQPAVTAADSLLSLEIIYRAWQRRAPVTSES